MFSLSSFILFSPAGGHVGGLPSNADSAAPAVGMTKITLQTDWYPQPEHAASTPHWQKATIATRRDLSIVPGGPFAIASKQVATGAAQFGMDSSDHLIEAVSAAASHRRCGHDAKRSSRHHGAKRFSDPFLCRPGRSHDPVKAGSTWFEFLVKPTT